MKTISATKVRMSFEECYLGHTPILDHTTGTVVCANCALVLDEFLTYDEVHFKTAALKMSFELRSYSNV